MGIQALADKFEGARGKLFAGATAAAVALPLTLGGLALTANNAYAQDATLQNARHELQITDKRDRTRDAVQFLSVKLSQGAQTIILYGPNKESFKEVREAAEQALLQNDNTFNWLVVASGEPELAIYTNGQLTSTILNPGGENLDKMILEHLAEDLAKIQRIELALNSD